LDERGASVFDVRDEAQRGFNDYVQGEMDGTVWTADHCKSWYLDAHGKNRTLWPTWTFEYRRRMKRFEPDEYELSGRAASA
jgi:hypothetical protein